MLVAGMILLSRAGSDKIFDEQNKDFNERIKYCTRRQIMSVGDKWLLGMYILGCSG